MNAPTITPAQVIDMPRTARELALASGRIEQQAQRDKKRLKSLTELQSHLFAGVVV